jgi:glycosyltransferase involved in cell wall biosynthesis
MIYFIKKYLRNFKWIISVHGKYDTYLESTNFSNKVKKRFMILLANYWEESDALIVISDSVRDWVVDLNGNLNPVVIPYWIDQSNLNSIHKPKEDISIGFLGRLNKNKGIEDLLEVFNNIHDEKITLKIGGHAEKSYLQYLNQISFEEKRKNIKYLGYIKNRKKFFDSIDIFIFPSFSEGLGLVLLEAMSFSKICLTRDISPMNGYLSNESGYLFNDNNEMLDSLSQAINDYRLDSNKIKSKLFNIEEVVKKSSVASIFPLIEKVYNYE